MTRQRVIVQASSVSWSGGRDYCMTIIEGQPVVYWTIKRVLENIPDPEVIIAAPAFDRGGELESFVNAFPTGNVSILYGHDDSPLNRMVDACKDLGDEDYIIRVDGLHFCFDPNASMNMLNAARARRLDCTKLPDDFPIAFTSDVYRVGALRSLEKLIGSNGQAIFKVHPKFFMFMQKNRFHCEYLKELPQYSGAHLLECRHRAEPITNVPRMEVDEHQKIWSGDQLSLHYELALEYLQPDMEVLDIACGDGFGVRILAQKVALAYGSDIDAQAVAEAKQRTHVSNASFQVEDITRMTYVPDQFDAVTSMETLEHVDAHSCLREIYRVLKPGGLLVLSTPQNSMGHIPVTSCHLHEYSLKEVVDLCSRYFTIQNVIGIKAGRIIVPGDAFGTNTMLVCVKEIADE